jgi:hypothetical protein
MIIFSIALEDPSHDDLKRIWGFEKDREMVRQAFDEGKITSPDNIRQEATASHIETTIEHCQWYAITFHISLLHSANMLQAPTELPKASAIAHRT